MRKLAVLLQLLVVASLIPVQAQTAKPVAKPSAPAKASIVSANDEIIKLTKAEMSEEIILAVVAKTDKSKYDTSADALLKLKAVGVSQKVIAAMLGIEVIPLLPSKQLVPTVAPVSPVVVAPSGNPRTQRAEQSSYDGKPTVAVLDFDYAAVKREWSGVIIAKGDTQSVMDVWDVGKGIADLLVYELLHGGEIRLLERKKLDNILQEQDLSHSDRADVSAKQVAKLSKILGAKYILTGSVTKFGSEDSHFNGLGGGGGFFSGIIGAVGFKKTTARVSLSARIVDSSTGEILVSEKGEGQSKRKGMLFGGMAVAGGKSAIGGIDMGSSNFQETILGEATMMAVKETAAKLMADIKKLTLN